MVLVYTIYGSGLNLVKVFKMIIVYKIKDVICGMVIVKASDIKQAEELFPNCKNMEYLGALPDSEFITMGLVK